MKERILTKYPDNKDRKEGCPVTCGGVKVFFAFQRLSWTSNEPAFRVFGGALAFTHAGGSTECWQLRGRRDSSNIACLLWE